ncbi:MAG: metallophosphoesterase [Clostridia bacterium]|nr:metallophosphoesterase [Clostridia bacterium]
MKYYVVADVHGYYTPMKKALKDAGFFEEKEPCKLIVCGDLLDRGKEANQTVDFMMQLLKEGKLIYIRGNHEDLFVRCLQEIASGGVHEIASGMSVHHQNGTWDSLLQISSMGELEAYNNASELVRRVRNSQFYKKLLSECVDYFETQNYIFTHGWIPCKTYGFYPRLEYKYNENWRNANVIEWGKARWYNGMDIACRFHAIVPNKTTVCGHWHASYGHSKFEKKGDEVGKNADYTPFYGKGIIAIDACTARSGIVNCVVIED